MTTYIEKLRELGACKSALEWLERWQHPDLCTAWNACERPDWLFWLSRRRAFESPDRTRATVLAARDLARAVVHLAPIESLQALQVLDLGDLDRAQDLARAAIESLQLAYVRHGAIIGGGTYAASAVDRAVRAAIAERDHDPVVASFCAEEVGRLDVSVLGLTDVEQCAIIRNRIDCPSLDLFLGDLRPNSVAT